MKETKKKTAAVKAKRIYLRNIDSDVFFSRVAAASDDFETGSGSSHVSFLFFLFSLNLFFLDFLFPSSLTHSSDCERKDSLIFDVWFGVGN